MTKHPTQMHVAGVDRRAHLRSGIDPTQCFAIVVRDGAVLVADANLVECAPGHHPEYDLWVYLGHDSDRDYIGVAALRSAAEDDGIGGERMMGLRDYMVEHAARSTQPSHLDLAVTAVALTTWHSNHGSCAACGAATSPVEGGWLRRCGDCAKDHYPRTDPAVIVSITDDQDRMLLAHAGYWSAGRYSHLAGYVEPGESLEAAVHREVGEEAGVVVDSVAYWGSQPWPFPASMMVAFTATAVSSDVTVDGDEITDAKFFSREELSAAVADGNVIVAPVGSIARAMLDEWWHHDRA